MLLYANLSNNLKLTYLRKLIPNFSDKLKPRFNKNLKKNTDCFTKIYLAK